ncbi:sensor histidine kinase [Falsihalocynthiibacter sp. S25ZX9]|uniref:sensor histidine kinase n=1 Tax=Falsihalocynthiibacter sp. S25ZX9 TaxID=3240870 RepID=UPI00350F1586
MTQHWRPPLILVLAGGLSGTLALSFAGIVALRYLGPEIGFRNAAIVLGVAITCATAVLGWLLLRLILRPILALERYAAEVRFDSTSQVDAPVRFGTRELHHTSQSVIGMATTLRDREATIRSFTDHVTHEIKTPVAAIRAAVELLEDGGMLSAEDLKIVQEIDGAQAQIQTQLDALRRAVQARETRYLGTCTLVDIRDAVVANFPTLGFHFSGEHTKIPISSNGMHIVLQQLLQNAVEQNASQINLAAEETPDEIHITIQDNGSGISAGNADRIFNAFFTTKRESGGTGMGLSIARNVIAAHNGKITCKASDSGAQFQIAFPRLA